MTWKKVKLNNSKDLYRDNLYKSFIFYILLIYRKEKLIMGLFDYKMNGLNNSYDYATVRDLNTMLNSWDFGIVVNGRKKQIKN
jgi:hypothetical protein